MNNQVEQYLTGLLSEKADWVKQLENDAEKDRVPIMEPLGIDFLMQMIRVKQPKKILEIGAAIGYSALRMSEANPLANIVTVERDEVRYQQAVENVTNLNKQENINIILGDAIESQHAIKEQGPFDLLFIDAAKGHYQQFFETFSEMLTEDGIIISDNVLFKGLVADDSSGNERLSKIASKLRHFNEWLVNHPTYKTTIIPIGDGVAITVKR